MNRAGAGWRRLASWGRAVSAATPLRVKLIAALLVLVTLGLSATGVAGVVALRGYLMDRVDSQLADTVHAMTRDDGQDSTSDYGRPALSTSFYALVTEANGSTRQIFKQASGDQTPPKLPTMDQATVQGYGAAAFTVRATGAGHAWRVMVQPVTDPGTGAYLYSVTVALSLDDVDETVSQLILIEVVVGGAVVFVLAALGYTAIRSSLRPLMRVESTAAAIAGGDLTRRVPQWPPRTEVGRLASALNGMLAQIETAFGEREAAAAQARASEARMRQFIADASHELRTPLTSVRGFAELLRHQSTGQQVPAGDVVLVASDRIERAATRMGLLVDDLLLLARLDQQRPLESRPVDLLGLAADAVGEARMATPDHPVELVGPGDSGHPPVVRGDLAKLRQVMANLLGNAFQHTPPGTPVTVTVSTFTGAGEAVLEVADAGPGLRPEEADRVFERFYRVDAARNRASGGTGLGLSIVASIVSAHGGRVSVRTAPGEGARFRVSLPLLKT